jgi:hypothetical protein
MQGMDIDNPDNKVNKVNIPLQSAVCRAPRSDAPSRSASLLFPAYCLSIIIQYQSSNINSQNSIIIITLHHGQKLEKPPLHKSDPGAVSGAPKTAGDEHACYPSRPSGGSRTAVGARTIAFSFLS